MVKLASERNMVPFDLALELTDRMRDRFYRGLSSEAIPLSGSLGRRLSADVAAAASSPAYNISTMDGYALSTKGDYPYRIVGEIFAGEGLRTLGPGETAYITTGAAVPEGADAVLKVEDAAAEGGMLRGPRLEPWTSVIRAGADFGKGEVILKKDALVSPGAMCALSAAAVEEVDVYKKARVGVLATGDEIKNGMTRDSNTPMVCAMLETWGCVPERLGVAPDDAAKTEAMLDDAAARCDAVITIGGVSVGKKDFIISTISQEGDIIFHGYRVRPGKPLLVSYYHDKPVFSLPGKPTGAYTAMELIVKRFFLGDITRPTVCVPLGHDVRFYSKGFDYVVYVQLTAGKAIPMGYEDSPLKLFSGPGYGVSIVSASPRAVVADGFIMARDDLEKGREVIVNLLV